MRSSSRLALLIALAGCASPVGGPEGPGPAIRSDVVDEALMYALAGTTLPTGQSAALVAVRSSGDRRFVAPLLELVRAGVDDGSFGTVLDELTGQKLADEPEAAAAWWAGAGLEPPSGFLRWKGELLAGLSADDSFLGWLHAGAGLTVDAAALSWTGDRPTARVPIDHPAHVPAEAATFLGPDDAVVGIEREGLARAYPLRVLRFHGVVNDTLSGRPVSIVAVDAEAPVLLDVGLAPQEVFVDGGDGERMLERLALRDATLRVGGRAVVADGPTGSLFLAVEGRPIAGPLAAAKRSLPVTPMERTSWAAWKEAHPRTTVLSLDTGYARPYLSVE